MAGSLRTSGMPDVQPTSSLLLHRPDGQLAEFVSCFWSSEGYRAPTPRERALPSGSLEIVINLREDRTVIYDASNIAVSETFSGIMVCGAQAGCFVIDTPPDAAVMGVHFKAGGALPFLKASTRELEGSFVSLDAVWGADAGRLRESLIEARDAPTRFARLERSLLQRLREGGRPRQHPALAVALRAFEDPHLRSVAEVGERAGLSPRRLIDMFREQVGLAPKVFWRVRRLQRALRGIEREKGTSLARLALDAGYCDQPHLNRELRALTGLRPGELLAHELQRPHHAPFRG